MTFPDGGYLHGTGSSSGGADVTDKPGRLKDLNFLVDELARIIAGDPFFGGQLDPDRIAAFTARAVAPNRCPSIGSET